MTPRSQKADLISQRPWPLALRILAVIAALWTLEIDLDTYALHAHSLDLGVFESQAIEKILGGLGAVLGRPAFIRRSYNCRIPIRLIYQYSRRRSDRRIPHDINAITTVP